MQANAIASSATPRRRYCLGQMSLAVLAAIDRALSVGESSPTLAGFPLPQHSCATPTECSLPLPIDARICVPAVATAGALGALRAQAASAGCIATLLAAFACRARAICRATVATHALHPCSSKALRTRKSCMQHCSRAQAKRKTTVHANNQVCTRTAQAQQQHAHG